jgi:RNA polymerase sigma factor (sigma-70 family)
MAIREALASLPPRERAAVILRHLLDFTVSETSQTLDCPERTVKRLTSRALEKLQIRPEIRDLKEARPDVI